MLTVSDNGQVRAAVAFQCAVLGKRGAKYSQKPASVRPRGGVRCLEHKGNPKAQNSLDYPQATARITTRLLQRQSGDFPTLCAYLPKTLIRSRLSIGSACNKKAL